VGPCREDATPGTTTGTNHHLYLVHNSEVGIPGVLFLHAGTGGIWAVDGASVAILHLDVVDIHASLQDDHQYPVVVDAISVVLHVMIVWPELDHGWLLLPAGCGQSHYTLTGSTLPG
jgi:hypothetical protein